MIRMVVGKRDVRFDISDLIAGLRAGDVERAVDFLDLFREVAAGRGACFIGPAAAIREPDFPNLTAPERDVIRAAYVQAVQEDCQRDVGILRDLLDERAEGVPVAEMLECLGIHDDESATASLGFDPWLINRQCEICAREPAVVRHIADSGTELCLCAECNAVLFESDTSIAPHSRREHEIDGGVMQWRDV